jgi:hypothetical protein
MANQMAGMKAQLDRLMAQIDQRIPPAMIPASDPTLAQKAYAAPPMSFSNDGLDDDEQAGVNFNELASGPQEAGDGNPLFIEGAEELETADSASGTKKPGWPKGKPRGPHKH